MGQGDLARPDDALSAPDHPDENAPTVSAIYTRLDGLPLAIELAAPAARALAPAAILDRLDRRRDALTEGAADMPARHRSLRTALASRDLRRHRALATAAPFIRSGPPPHTGHHRWPDHPVAQPAS